MAGRDLFATLPTAQPAQQQAPISQPTAQPARGRDLFAVAPPEQPEAVEESMLPSLSKTAKSVIPSAIQYGKNIAQAVTQPIQTAEALTGLAVGGIQKLLPVPEDEFIVSPQGRRIYTSGKDQRQKWESFSDAMGERYGGWDKIKNTIETDPVGFIGDAAAVMMPVGGAIGKAGAAIEPVTAVRNIIGAAGRKLSPSAQKKLYISALKMTTSKKVSTAERAARAETGISKGILPTSQGLKKLNREIRKTDLQVQRAINKGSRAGDTVSIEAILKPTAKIRDKAKHSMDRESILNTVDNVEAELRNHPDLVNGRIPTKSANEIKKRAWADLDGKFGEAQALEIEARKAIGSAARQELEKLYPRIGALNKDSGAMRGLRDSVEASVKRLENNNAISLSDWIILSGAGAASGVAGGAGAVALKKIISSPSVKAASAFALRKASKAMKTGEGLAAPAQIAEKGGRIEETQTQRSE